MSSTEERIIARLEDTISSLAHQVGELALEKVVATTDDNDETERRDDDVEANASLRRLA